MHLVMHPQPCPPVHQNRRPPHQAAQSGTLGTVTPGLPGQALARFACHKCGKVYRWKGNLSQHLRFECGKAPQFRCPYCPYRSKHRSDVKNKHMKYKHPGQPFLPVVTADPDRLDQDLH